MALKAACQNTPRWIWPSIACFSIGAFAWSNIRNYNEYELSLQEFKSEIHNLRQIISSQKQSIHKARSIISSVPSVSTTPSEGSNSYSHIIKSVTPSIVNLVIESESTVRYGMFQVQQPTKQLGTGVIIREDGIIVTNNHVITTSDLKEDQRITAYLSNRRKVNAHIVLKDELNDLALLKIDCYDDERFPYIEINDDVSSIEVGDRVLAIGNNFGLHNTVTDGIISAIGRAEASQIPDDNDVYGRENDLSKVKISKNPYLPFLQTNAAINPGSSGGALIDVDKHRLIGINTSIASPIGVNIGIGFAIPSSYVLSLLRSVEAPFVYDAPQIIRPWDGLDVTKKVIDARYLSENVIQRLSDAHLFYVDGVEVVEMHRQSPAKQKGIKEGDVLIRMNDTIEIDSQDKYWMVLNGFRPNETVKYWVLRWKEKEYELLDFDVSIMQPPRSQSEDVLIRDSRNVLNGCLFGELQPSLGIELGINASNEGVMLMKMPYPSVAAQYGFRAGDILLEIDGVKIQNVQQLRHVNVNRRSQHNIVVQRGNMVGQIIV
eukprot:164289_1